jgi:cobalt/nickel transport system permease protein
MADALISPEVGGAMWVVSGAGIIYASKRISDSFDDFKVPLMGVMGAFVFAAQMINFSIPGTGSSGHIVGALLLSVLLGPYAALLAIASVLVVQALFFADGGLLALGCNIFNMGVLPCFVAYPLIYKVIVGEKRRRFWILTGTVIASLVALTLGALFVVLETCASGISELPFSSFILVMLPIHLAIGVIEGIVTGLVLSLLYETRADLLSKRTHSQKTNAFSLKSLLVLIGLSTLLISGVLSWFASENPDGLEWSIAKVTGTEELAFDGDATKRLSKQIQKSTSLFPDYSFRESEISNIVGDSKLGIEKAVTSVAGVVGVALTLILAFFTGWLVKFRSRAIKVKENL